MYGGRAELGGLAWRLAGEKFSGKKSDSKKHARSRASKAEIFMLNQSPFAGE